MKIFLIGIVLLTAGVVWAGDKGNGGDGVALEFKSIAKALDYGLKNWKHPGFDYAKIQPMINESTVESTIEKLVLDGITKDAINYPDKKLIVINRYRWLSLRDNQALKVGLVLHEYLGLAKIQDTNYEVSSAFLNIDPKTLKNLPPIVDLTSTFQCTWSISARRNGKLNVSWIASDGGAFYVADGSGGKVISLNDIPGTSAECNFYAVFEKVKHGPSRIEMNSAYHSLHTDISSEADGSSVSLSHYGTAKEDPKITCATHIECRQVYK